MSKIYDYTNFPGWLTIVEGQKKEFEPYTDVSRMAPSGSVLRFIRGERCTDKKSTLQEFAAALQFPYYFGMNWDAFDECMADLEWLPGGGYIIIVTDSEYLLSNEKGEFTNLVKTLKFAAEYWEQEQKKPFKIIFHASPYATENVKFMIESSGSEAAVRKKL